jgi:hypothetical protein
MLYVRSLYLGYEYYLTGISLNITTPTSLFQVLKLFGIFITFLLFFILFYTVLNLLFFDELLKLYIYFKHKEKIASLLYYCNMYSVRDFFGPLYLIFDCIVKGTAKPNDFYYDDHFIYQWIFEKPFVNNVVQHCIFLCNYKIIFIVFVIFNKLLRLCYRHLAFSAFLQYSHYFILLLIIFYDIMVNKFFLTYYALFLFVIITLIFKFLSFEKNQDHIFMGELSAYFYKNDYEKQRHYLFISNPINLLETEHNKNLLYLLTDSALLDLICNDFIMKKSTAMSKKIFWMYLRFSLISIMLFSMIFQYLFINNIHLQYKSSSITFMLFIPIIFMLLCHYNIFKKTIKDDVPDLITFEYHVYNKKYNYIFWVLCIIQIYIMWYFIFKSKFFIINEDILWAWDYFGITLNLSHTDQEKLEYFYEYLEKHLNLRSFDLYNKDIIFMYLSEIHISYFLQDSLSMQQIKCFVEDLCNNYVLINNNLVQKANQDFLELDMTYKNYYIGITSIFELIVLWDLFAAYSKALYFINYPASPGFRSLFYLFLEVIKQYRK